MAKLGTEAESTVYNTVFIDTSLDTRLAMNVSDTDTVSDLKQKIKVEHPGCFHANGEIKIHALKVKRKGNFYHLSDSMLVKSAFGEGRKNWFLSVDASSLKQHGGNQHLGLGKQDDQLALPWVTASPSEDGSSKRPSLIHQSSLLPVTNMHFANQKVHSVIQSTPGGSCREISTFMEAEDRYSNDNHLNVVNPDDFDRRLVLQVQEKYDVVKEGMISKKRTRDVKHGSSSEVALEHGPAAKKKHKTERKESVKSWEGEKDLISDTNDVKGKAETVKPENSAKDIQQSRDAISNGLVAEPLEGDHFRTSSISGKRKKKKTSRKGEDDSTAPHDQPAKNVSSYAGDVEEERFFDENVETTQTSKTQLDKVPNVSSVLGKNIQQETLTEPFGLSQKEKHDEPVQGMFQGNEVPCSPMRTFVGEHDATTVHGTSGAPQVAPESCIKGTNGFSKKPHKRNKGVVHSSHKTVVSNDQKFEDDVIDNCVEERKLPMNLDSEVNLRNGDMECENTGVGKIKKEKAKKSIAINKDESLLKHANNVVSDIPSTVPDPAFDGHLIDERKKDDSCLSHTERNKTLETKSTDVSNAYASREGDNVIVNEAEVLQPRERDRGQGNGEVVDEKSRKECGHTGRHKRKEKNPGKSASRNEDVLVAKCADNALSETKEKENILSLTEAKEMLEKKSIDASHVACDREANNVRGNEAEFCQQTETDRNQLNAEDMEEKSRKEYENTRAVKRKKKRGNKCAARNEGEIVEHANDAVLGLSSIVPNPASDDHLIDERKKDDSCLSHSERNKTLETKSTDVYNAYASREGDNVIVNEAEVLQPRERDRGQGNGEVVDEKSRKECGDTGRHKRKEKNPGKSASRNEDVLVANCADNALSETKEKENILSLTEAKEMLEKKSIDASHVACDREANNVRGNDAEFCQQTETDRNQLNAEDMEEKSRKEYENTRAVKRKKKRGNKCAARNEGEIVEHANDAVLGLSSIVPNPASDGHLIDERKKDDSCLSHSERNKTLETKSTDVYNAYASREGDNVIVNEAEVLQPRERDRGQGNGEVVDEKSRKECGDTGRHKRKEKNPGKSASRNEDVLVAKCADNALSETKEKENILSLTEAKEMLEKKSIDASHVACDREANNVRGNEAEFCQQTETDRNQLNAEDMEEKSRKEYENTRAVKRKKKRGNKCAARNEGEIVEHANDAVLGLSSIVPNPASDGHLIDERKKDDSCLSHSERNKTLETKSTDVYNAYASREGDNVIVNEAEVLQPRERDRGQGNGEVVDEKSRKECGDTGRHKRKEKNPGKSASRNEDVLVANCADNALSETKEKENILSLTEAKEMLEKKSIDASHVACDREANNVRGNEAEFCQQTETDRNQLNAEDMEEKSRKEYENTRGVKRKKKRANKCAARNEGEIVEHANDAVLGLSSIVPNPASDGHLINKTEKDKTSLSNTVREEIQEEKSMDLSHANVRKETNNVNVNVNEVNFSQSGEASRSQEKMNDKSRNGKKICGCSTANSLLCFPTEEQRNGVDNLQLNQLDRTQENARRLDKGIDRIKARPDLPSKDQEVDLNEFTASNVQVKDIHEMRDMDTISKTKKTGSVKTSDLGQSTGSELEAEKNNGLPLGSSLPEQISEDVLSEVPPSQIPDNITKARTEGKVDIDNHVNISKPDSGEIDFMHYFAPADEVKDSKRLDREIKANKNTKKLHAQRNYSKNYSSIQSQETMSKDENSEVLSSKKRPSLVSGDGVKGPSFPDNDQIKTLKEPRKIDTLKVSRTSRSAPANKGNSNPLAASSSSSSSEGYHRSPRNQVNNKHQSSVVQSGVVVRKAPTKKTGQVIKSSRCVKSLLATPGAIFWDGSDESSADDNGTVNSDTSTSTPSNKSSSSGSEGESDSSLDSRRNGSYAC